MTLGLGVFASVVLILLVYNEKFRKVMFWLSGIGAVCAGLFFGGVYLYNAHEERVQENLRKQWTVVSETPAPPEQKAPVTIQPDFSDAAVPKPAKKRAGVITACGTGATSPIAIVYIDTQEHASTLPALECGKHVTILGRANGVYVTSSGYIYDFVHVSFDGKKGWIKADVIAEDAE